MLNIQRLREKLKFDPLEDHKLNDLRDSIIGLWEELTNGLWNYRVGHLQILELPSTDLKKVYLELRPVVSVSLVEEKDSVWDATWRILASTEYFLLGANAIRRVSGFWKTSVRITYIGGYTDTTCPKDIQRALIVQSQFQVQRNKDEKITVKSEGFEGGSEAYLQASIHPYFQSVVSNRRRK